MSSADTSHKHRCYSRSRSRWFAPGTRTPGAAEPEPSESKGLRQKLSLPRSSAQSSCWLANAHAHSPMHPGWLQCRRALGKTQPAGAETQQCFSLAAPQAPAPNTVPGSSAPHVDIGQRGRAQPGLLQHQSPITGDTVRALRHRAHWEGHWEGQGETPKPERWPCLAERKEEIKPTSLTLKVLLTCGSVSPSDPHCCCLRYHSNRQPRPRLGPQ